jgi:DNA-binding response OmpR family regulator
MSHILIVEDEQNLGKTLSTYLSGLGHTCQWADHPRLAMEYFNEKKPDVVLMDIGLPEISGLELAKKMRKKSNFVLLFLSAYNDPETKLEGLEIGADDYITKPFALKELTLRLERILKFQNIQSGLPEEISIGKLKIYFKSYRLIDAQGAQINLGQKECAILQLLYKNQNNVISREEIIDEIWGEEAYPSSRTVDNYIVGLRRWCESDKDGQMAIESIRGVGYKLAIKGN